MNLLNLKEYEEAKLKRWRELKLELISFKTAMMLLSVVFFLALALVSLVVNIPALESLNGLAAVFAPLLMAGVKTYKDSRKQRRQYSPYEGEK